jgi:hypothetical protein
VAANITADYWLQSMAAQVAVQQVHLARQQCSRTMQVSAASGHPLGVRRKIDRQWDAIREEVMGRIVWQWRLGEVQAGARWCQAELWECFNAGLLTAAGLG